MDNPNVKVVDTRFGKGLVASGRIKKDEIITESDGPMYTVEKTSDLPKDVADHAIQCGPHQWRDSKGIMRYANHSCEPNLGYRGLFTLVAMRDIDAGEELLLDYDMSENSDWRMECKCGTSSCRKIIGSFDALPQETKAKYNGYISEWLK